MVKLFVEEDNSRHTHDTVKSYANIVVCEVTWVESISAFSRMQLINRLSSDTVAGSIRSFKEFWPGLEHVKMNWDLIDEAADIAEKHRLRAYDSIQLAAASWISHAGSDVRFFSWDKTLNLAAKAEGLLLA